MRLTLLGLFLLAAPLCAEPSQSDRYKYRPLVCAARLWNLVHYLHPRVAGDSTDWDNALLAALPKIEEAHSDEELALALDDMLKTLHDPCTRIAFGLSGPGVTVQSLDSDTMVIRAGNGDLSGSMGAGLMLKMGIPQTRNLIWDVRSSRIPYLLSPRPEIGLLPMNGIGYAFRQHIGYPPPDATASRYYSSSLQIVEPPKVAPKKSSIPFRRVYLADRNSAIPIQAIIDQVNGRSAIISEDPPQDLQAGFTQMVNVLDKVVAEVRVAELYYPDGTTEFSPTRVVLNRGQEAVKAMSNVIRSQDWGTPGERPDFELRPSAFHDMAYEYQPYPSREMRLLGAFRIWGIMHFFNPRVSPMGDKWDDALIEMLPKFFEAQNAKDYHMAIAGMVALTGDRSAVARSTVLETALGSPIAPYEVRFIENQPVITHLLTKSSAQVGDVIVKIDGEPVEARIERFSRYFSGARQVALESQLARHVLTLRGKDNTERSIAAAPDMAKQKFLPAHRTGDAVRLINAKIGYADLERVEAAELDAMFEKLQQTDAIIFDLRGYPRDNALAIAARLGTRKEPVAAHFVRNVMGVWQNDGYINSLQTDLRIPSTTKSRYMGKTVALIDEASASVAGESAICFKAANDTVLIGSDTYPTFPAFATAFDVPGGVKVYFSGQSTRWPDGTALQGQLIHPDVEARPTLAGLRGGLDEVLAQAVAYLSKM